MKINSRMFVYDANKQAYIADPKAGSYRELVEAAESCKCRSSIPASRSTRPTPGLPSSWSAQGPSCSPSGCSHMHPP